MELKLRRMLDSVIQRQSEVDPSSWVAGQLLGAQKAISHALSITPESDWGEFVGLKEREEIKMGGRMIEVTLGRFPTVYGDWVNLAEDIKDKRPDLATEVNTSLNYIMRHDSEMAKQQLEKIAKEIGIM